MATGTDYVTLTYLPEGRSVPEERTVYMTGTLRRRYIEDLDELIDVAIDLGWEEGVPLTVRDQAGKFLWFANDAERGPGWS